MSPTLVTLNSECGQKLLNDCKADNGGLYQSNLHSIFRKQVGDSTCGIASSALILSAPHASKLNILDVTSETRLPYTEQNMFDYKQTLSVVSKEQVIGEPGGLTLTQLSQLLDAHGLAVRKVHASNDIEKGVELLRADVKEALSSADSKKCLVINYHMEVLGQGCPYGHISPLAAYHAATDRVLILDTWRDTEECWATVHDLYVAMNTVDSVSGFKRGYVVAAL